MKSLFLLLTLILAVVPAHAWDHNGLMTASGKCDSTDLKWILNHPDVDVNVRSTYISWKGYTPLLLAVKHGCLKNVELLLDAGAVPTDSIPETGPNALGMAIQLHHRDIAVLLAATAQCRAMEDQAKKIRMIPTRSFGKTCKDAVQEMSRITRRDQIDETCKKSCSRIAQELNLKPNEVTDVVEPCVKNCQKEAQTRLK